MNKEFYFNFPIEKMKISFQDFDNKYLDFVNLIYSDYITDAIELPYSEEAMLKYNGNGSVYILHNLDITNDLLENLYNILHSIICSSICEACNSQEKMVLHASSFILDDKSYILLGNKSSGKTTALLYFLKHGGIYTGDEIVVADKNGVQPYSLPLRVKQKTMEFLSSKFNYSFEFHNLPDGINNKKQYLLKNNDFKSKIIQAPIKADCVIVMNEFSNTGFEELTFLEFVKHAVNCIRNSSYVKSIGNLSAFEKSKLYYTDFTVGLDKLYENVV